MATVQTIATTLTADARPAIQNLRTFDAEVGRAFTRLDRLNKRATPMGGPGGAAREVAALGNSSSNATRGVLELSRGFEDFASQVGNAGFTAGIRGASNNISQFAMMVGGPLAGAVAGFAAAGLTVALPWIESLLKATNAARDFKQEMEAIDAITKRSQDRVAREVGFAQLSRQLTDSSDAASQLRDRMNEVERINAQINDMNRLRQPLIERAQNPAFSDQAIADRDAAAEEDRKLFREQMDMLRQRKQLEEEINRLKKQRIELQRQEAAQEFANIIRGFQEGDVADQLRNNDRIQRIIESELGKRGVMGDPLEGMDIPEDVRRRLEGIMGAPDGRRTGPQFASVATANSQSLLRLQVAAKEAAEARKLQQQQVNELKKLLEELKNIRRGIEDGDGDDVNLN